MKKKETNRSDLCVPQAKKFDTAETMAFKQRNTEVLVRLKQVRLQQLDILSFLRMMNGVYALVREENWVRW